MINKGRLMTFSMESKIGGNQIRQSKRRLVHTAPTAPGSVFKQNAAFAFCRGEVVYSSGTTSYA